MKRFKNILTAFAFALLIVGVPTIASAQWRNDRNDRNDNYGNRGGFVNMQTLRAAVNRLEKRAQSFERRLDRELDRSRYEGSRREDRVNDIAGDFKRAANRFEDRFDNGRNMNRSADEAREVLNAGSRLDRVLSRIRLSSGLEYEWNAIRHDLRIIANAYNSGFNDRTNRNDRRGNFPLDF